ncbi:MAG TPA: IS1182 family transposase [Accumulibacter sp.]|nr:IS1182 family transposase [Accumulibacter sp.]
MTLHPHSIPDVPEVTAQVARAAFRKGNPYMQMRDELGTLFTDEQFSDLFPNVGQLAETPWRLALVTVMQFAENLTDRQAADAVRARIDWKYALSLELTDEGFNFSVLSEFRQRLMTNGAEARLFEIMLAGFQERELLKAGGKQRTDSTHILANVRELNRIEFVGETLRAALNELATVAPEWLRSWVPAEWFKRYGHAFSEYRLPQKEAERLELGEQIGRDGMEVLRRVYAETSQPELAQLPQVEVLRRVWVLQFYTDEDDLTRWRRKGNTPPGERIVTSPHDTDARLSKKRGKPWVGYKVHLTESCDDDKPHLVTHVETTLATTADNAVVELIYTELDRKQCLPGQHLVDNGYGSGTAFVNSRDHYGVDLFGPARPDISWQAQVTDAFDISHFRIDFELRTVTCPQGHTTRQWSERLGIRGKPVIQTQFPKKLCRSCPIRERCTTDKSGRQLTFMPEPEFSALQAARQREQTDEFKEAYKKRAGVEGTISQAVGVLGMRRTRYRGLDKVHLQHLMTAAAMNLMRVLDWLSGKQRAATRKSAFARLAVA